jgi:hypothetical protein
MDSKQYGLLKKALTNCLYSAIGKCGSASFWLIGIEKPGKSTTPRQSGRA